MNIRIMAVALVVVSMLGVRAAQAQPEVPLVRVVPYSADALRGSWAGILDRVIIIIGTPNDTTITFPGGCGSIAEQTWEAVDSVVLRPGTAFSTAFLLPIYHLPGEELAPGTRLSPGLSCCDLKQCCLDENEALIGCGAPAGAFELYLFEKVVIEPGSAGAALFTSLVELDTDAIGVVTGQPNDDGTQTVIFKKQGSPAQQVDIDSDVGLLPADVLRDLIDLGQDPDTGEHLYLADIEW